MASYGVVVESPDGRGCASGAPFGGVKGDFPPICNWYTLAWLADEPRVADWLREGTAFPAAHADGLEYRLGAPDPAAGGTPFWFQGPGFRLDAVGRERPGELSVRGGYWAETTEGTVKLPFSTEDLVSGDANGTVTAAAGSELAALLGAQQRPYAAAYSGFSAERWEQAFYRKQVLGTPPGSDHFDGSCAVQGEVTFTPPATTTEQPLRYAYEAHGTCTGRLDGRELADAPVTVRQAGSVHASCLRDRTTAPGDGALTFADGTTVRYTLDFTGVATEVDFTLYGERAGTAPGTGTFRTSDSDPGAVANCGGDGLDRATLAMEFTTEGPLVSLTAPAPQAQPAPARAGERASRLRLSVAPRTARSGRRTAFRFRVRDAAGRPVSGALVRFAGRRARAAGSGRATIVARVRRRGRRTARATKAGHLAGGASVLVRGRRPARRS
jgi:hypothetical protein